MKRELFVCVLLVSILLCTGCSQIESEQIVTSIEAGSKYNLIDYISVEDSVAVSVKQNCIEDVKVGTYPVTYVLENKDNECEVTYNFEIVDTTAPELSIPSEITLFLGETFEPKRFIKCYDIVDGDLTTKVSYDVLDTNLSGKYQVNLEVADNSGNISTDVLNVHVEEYNPYAAASNCAKALKNSLNNPTSLDIKAMHLKKEATGYIFWVSFENLGGYGATVSNELYIKTDEDGVVADYSNIDVGFWGAWSFWDVSFVWGEEYLASDSDEIGIDCTILSY